jgi:Uma2 family endonuclease
MATMITARDLADLPDDGRRYELVKGSLLASPAPSSDHQTVVLELAIRLRAVRPEGFRVFIAPFTVRLSDSTELQPDVLVTMEEDITAKNLPKAPLLAVEVLSPSTAINDFNTKKALYEQLGTPSYWVIDPIDPVLTVFELDKDGRYEQIAVVKGDDVFEAAKPFPARIVPATLLAG